MHLVVHCNVGGEERPAGHPFGQSDSKSNRVVWDGRASNCDLRLYDDDPFDRSFGRTASSGNNFLGAFLRKLFAHELGNARIRWLDRFPFFPSFWFWVLGSLAAFPLEFFTIYHKSGVVFSSQLASCLSKGFLRSVQRMLPEAGRLMDRQHNFTPKAVKKPLDRHMKAPRTEGLKSPLCLADLANTAVLLKPPFWEVYGGHTKDKSKQLLTFVKEIFGKAPIFDDKSHFCGFLHRLDVPSSGLILVSKTYEAHYNLQVQLHAGCLERHYQVLSHGRFSTRKCINANLLWHGDGPTFAGGQGRTARTQLILEGFALDSTQMSFSQLEIQIATGRKHQIRSHLAHVGHPVVGDGTYASLKTFLADRAVSSRHWLHRHCVTFNVDGKNCTVQSDIPEDLHLSLRRLQIFPVQKNGALQSLQPHVNLKHLIHRICQLQNSSSWCSCQACLYAVRSAVPVPASTRSMIPTPFWTP